MSKVQNRQLMTTSRKELDIELNIIEGNLPTDIYGHFFVVYPVGNVNSNLPITATLPDGTANPDYGSPIMNGDGMVMRIDFDKPGKAIIKSRITKTPCFYADSASKFGTKYHRKFGFTNHGIVRMGRIMGARNEANTALIPVKFEGQKNTSLLITYDCGKPYFLDPVSLEVLYPIGYNSEWHEGMPDIFRSIFPMIETTAHPTFDPYTKELFTVNFTKSNKNTFSSFFLERMINKDEDFVKKELNELKQKIDSALEHSEAIQHIKAFLDTVEKEAEKSTILRSIYSWIKKIIDTIKDILTAPGKLMEKEFSNEDKFFLIRFDGKKPMQKWEVRQEDGSPIVIHQCMHQISINKDYILLVDTSFKFSLDLLLKNPAPNNPTIEKLIRDALAVPMLPYCDAYLVARNQLTDDRTHIIAKKLKQPLPLETVHFNSTYDSTNNEMNLFCIHNSAVCIAEWIRPYDTSKFSGETVDKDYVGMFSIGDMDISRLGQYTLDCENAEIKSETIFYQKGKALPKGCGANTWGIGLISFPDIVSAENIPDEYTYVWYMANGPDPKMLTDFIFDMYEKYPNRIIPIDEVLEFNKAGLPFVLNRYNCHTHSVDDFYELEAYTYLRSHYFMPSSNPAKGKYDGYLCATLQVGKTNGENGFEFHNEIWIFDTKNISQGPICKMANPELEYCFQLHTAWLPEIAPHHLDYRVDVKKDIQKSISRLLFPWDKIQARRFMKKHVYPHF